MTRIGFVLEKCPKCGGYFNGYEPLKHKCPLDEKLDKYVKGVNENK